MRLLSWIVAAAVVTTAITLSPEVWRLPAFAESNGVTTCPTFTSVKWVSAMDSSETGDQYAVSINKNAMSCADATEWAKKLIPTHIGGSMGSTSALKGGPDGYDCVGFPDHAGIAYRGRCVKPGMGVVPGFSWSSKQ